MIFIDSQFILSLISGIFIGGIAGYLGTLMLLKKMTVAVDPISHFVLPGIALAFLFNFDPSLGAFFSIIFGMVLVWFLESKTKLPTEALIAILFTTGVALAFLISPHEKLEEVLLGDISKINFSSTMFAISFSLLTFFSIRKIYKKMVLIEISEDLARAEKINPKFYLFLYLFFLSIIVALEVKLVGGLLTAVLIAIPAVTSRNFAKSLNQYSFFGIFFGSFSAFSGILLAKILNFETSILITFSALFLFLISLFWKK